MSNLEDVGGRVIFSEIAQLPDQWWNNPETVWTVWNKNTYYLWGANASNYDLKQGTSLSGGGMAGSNGPTRGYAHDHYIGLDTMQYSDTRNPSVFKKLSALLAAGRDIVVPTYKGCFSLGTGIAHEMPGWEQIQKQLFAGIADLAKSASALEVPAATFWPDCRTQTAVVDYNGKEQQVSICSTDYRPNLTSKTAGTVTIGSVADLQAIIDKL